MNTRARGDYVLDFIGQGQSSSLLKTAGQLFSFSTYCILLNIYKCIPFRDPPTFPLTSGLLTSKKDECVQFVFLSVCAFIRTMP